MWEPMMRSWCPCVGHGVLPLSQGEGRQTHPYILYIRRRAVISLGTPRLNFLCRSTQEELEREYKPLRTTHVTGYGRCEQLFTLFFAYQ